jgi:hypothetical protein
MNFLSDEDIKNRIEKSGNTLFFNSDDSISNLRFDFSPFHKINRIEFTQTFLDRVELIIGNQKIEFYQCKSNNNVLINSKSESGNKIIVQDSKFDFFSINEGVINSIEILKSSFKNISLNDCLLNGGARPCLIEASVCEFLNFNNVNSDGGILIGKSEITKEISIIASDIFLLSFFKSTTEGDFEARNSKISFSIFQSNFNGGFSCSNTKMPKFNSHFSQFVDEVYLDTSEISGSECVIEKLELVSNIAKGGIYIGNYLVPKEIEQDKISNAKINGIVLRFMGANTSDVIFRNITIGDFSMTGINKTSAIQVSDSLIEGKLVFVDLINLGHVSIGNCQFKKESRMMFYTANMGSFHLFAMDLSSYPIIDFYNSDLSKLNYYGLIWPNKQKILKSELGHDFSQNSNNPLSDFHDYLIHRKEFNLQLKKVAESKSDVLNVLKFHKFEMLFQEQLLKLDNKSSLGEHIILFLGKTNDYGNSWLRPVGLLLTFNFLMTGLLVFLLCNCSNSPEFGADPLRNFGNIFFELLNPLHSKQIYGAEGVLFIVIVLDYLHRLVVSFFAFQIVVAFRKYVRK